MTTPPLAPTGARIALPVLAALVLAAGCARDDGRGVHAAGQIEATDVRIAAKVSGTIARLMVDEGDTVRAGAVLAVIDTVDLDLVRRQAAGDRDQAKANLALANAGSRIEDIRAARADVEGRRADLEGAERDLARMQALLDKGLGAEQPRDAARVRRDMARAQLAESQQTLKRLEAGMRPEERAAARAAFDRAQARLDAIAQQIKDCTIVSPLTGTVTTKLVEAGELVTPGTGIVVVSDLAHPWLTVFVTGQDLPRVHLGAAARITTDAKGDKGRDGRVSFVSAVAEFTPRNVQTQDERAKLVYRVKIRVDNRDGAMKSGMPADAVILPGAANATVDAGAR